MNRDEARQLWARVAAGDLERVDPEDPVDLHAWVRQVASKLLEADELTSGQRPDAIVRASGLAGKRDAYPELRVLVEDVRWDFPVNAGGEDRYLTQRERVRLVLEEALRQGLFQGSYEADEKAARQLVRNLIAKNR